MPTFELGKHRGKYVAIYYDEHGCRKRRSLGTDNEALARTRLAESEHMLLTRALSRGHTVDDLFSLYLKDKQHEGKAKLTLQAIMRAQLHLQPAFGHLKPEHITRDNVRTHISERLTKVSRGTVNQELSYFRACLKWAKHQRLISDTPHIEVPSPPPPKTHYLTREDMKTVLEVCHTPHLRLFIILAVTTAARATALLELTWDRVDLNKGFLDLRKPGRAVTSKGRALVPLNKTAVLALSEAHRHSTCSYVIEYHSQGIKDIRHSMQVVSRKAGVKFTPHVLRHTAAVWMAEAGVPMSEISQYLGHKNTTVTERVYARYSPGYLRKAAEALDLEVSAPFGRFESGGV
jgi:integrase